jgi:hypothetical protein
VVSVVSVDGVVNFDAIIVYGGFVLLDVVGVVEVTIVGGCGFNTLLEYWNSLSSTKLNFGLSLTAAPIIDNIDIDAAINDITFFLNIVNSSFQLWLSYTRNGFILAFAVWGLFTYTLIFGE